LSVQIGFETWSHFGIFCIPKAGRFPEKERWEAESKHVSLKVVSGIEEATMPI